MKIVLINGEKQSGKSTLANHLANLLLENRIDARVYSFVKPYEIALLAMMRYNHGIGLGEEFTYEHAKNMPIYRGASHTGRDWMIQQGNAARMLDPYMLPGIFVSYIDAEPMVDVWVIENWGFADELHFFREPATIEWLGNPEIITVSLTARSTRQYQSGEQYDGDNRFCLDSLADYTNPKVNDLAAIVDEDHDYLVDTIAQQFSIDVEVHESPAPASDIDNQPSEAHEVDGEERPHTVADVERQWTEQQSDGTNT